MEFTGGGTRTGETADRENVKENDRPAVSEVEREEEREKVQTERCSRDSSGLSGTGFMGFGIIFRISGKATA